MEPGPDTKNCIVSRFVTVIIYQKRKICVSEYSIQVFLLLILYSATCVCLCVRVQVQLSFNTDTLC
jgi:hypothetical protein